MTQYNIPNGTWIHLKGNLTLLGCWTAERAVYIDVTHAQLLGYWLCARLPRALLWIKWHALTRASPWLSADWQCSLITTMGSSAHSDLWPPRGGRKSKWGFSKKARFFTLPLHACNERLNCCLQSLITECHVWVCGCETEYRGREGVLG